VGTASRATALLALAAASATACTPQSSTTAAAGHQSYSFAPHWEMRARARPLSAPRAAVASNSHLASLAGTEMLRRGGNAVDAAVATGFALAVTHPEAGSLGGGGFMVIHLNGDPATPGFRTADSVRTLTLDFRETAPAAATRDMFARSRPGRPSPTTGYHAIAVPGLVAGLVEAHSQLGALPMEAVIAPAVRLAEEGFVVDSLLARSILEHRHRIERFAGRDLLVPAAGRSRKVTHSDSRRWLRTLRRISAGGSQAFYRGPIAAEIAADVRRNGGILRVADLAELSRRLARAGGGQYRGYTMIGLPLPSSGILTAGHALMILEALGQPAPFGSVQQLHFTASAMQRAFIDRMQLGDPATTSATAVAGMRDRACRRARGRDFV
jgi:gamma-glutamyltranspeptidase / glutathione hydrolase